MLIPLRLNFNNDCPPAVNWAFNEVEGGGSHIGEHQRGGWNADLPLSFIFMRQILPAALLLIALVTALFSLFSEDSFSRLSSLRRFLAEQNEENQALRARVDELRTKVHDLRDDERALEKAARNELGLARPNEQIFIFEKKSGRASRAGLAEGENTDGSSSK